MCIRSLGGFNHWSIREESDEISWNEISMNMEFCKSQLIRQGTSSPFNKDLENWTPTRNKSTCSTLPILRKKAENCHTSPTSPKTREETTLGSCFPNELFLGTKLKAETQNSSYILHAGNSAQVISPLRLWSCAGASTTHLGWSLHAKEDQASDTTHFHRCLVTEILSGIWT